MEGFLVRGWDRVLPECGVTSTLARVENIPVRWLYEPQPLAISRWGWGFHAVRGGIDPGITIFVPGLLE